MVPLFLQSEEVLTILNKSVLENSLFGCLYQRAPFPKDPQPRDFLSVGTVCRILQLVKLPNRGIKVLIEGLSRVFIQNLILKVNPQSAIRILKLGKYGLF
jgi:ATP-dependent Lon protease